MKPFRLHAPARLLTVVWLMVSWLVATNHCAFGMMKPTARAQAVHAQCSGCPAPARQAPAGGTRECCQSIQGAPVPEKVGEKFETAPVARELWALLQVLALPPVQQTLTSLAFDHDPPRVVSFAEAVLQRSLLGHAPPVAV